MKELSIEQKAKRYDEALERAKKLQETCDSTTVVGWSENIFPELAESEDEKIRKEIVDFITSSNKYGTNERCEAWLAWLEKQGEYKPYGQRKECEDCQFNYAGECKGYCALKRNEQKPILDVKASDWYVSKVDGKIHNMYYSVDKVEPKFKVGDWVVTDYGRVSRVVYVDKYGDGYTLDDGVYFSGSWCNMYHPWTIQDAKDGDVLACESGWACIFKALDEHINTFSSYCFMDKDKWFCETGSKCHTLNKEFMKAYNGEIKPATKEQRDLLFAKMKEAGYEWNAEKKELRKIESKTFNE